MTTGATAATVYGQPRLTNDFNVVLALRNRQVPDLIAAFPEAEFCVPPETVIRSERSPSVRGCFKIPPEYVIVRKLEYFREGGSSKHPADIRAILATTDVVPGHIEPWVERPGLTRQWADMRS